MLGLGIMAGLSLLAGWLVNLIADTVPERHSILANWYSPLCQLPHSIRQRLNLVSACTNCRPHPWRHIVVWLFSFLLGWLAYQNIGWSLEGLTLAIHAWFFLAIAVIDIEHRLVLNRMLLAALPFIILTALLTGSPNLTSSLLGAATGFGIFLLIAILARGGMGMGDVKLAGVIGLATGLSGIITALLIGIYAGGLASVAILILNRFQRKQTMAYAPYLVIGAWTALYFNAELWQFYLGYL